MRWYTGLQEVSSPAVWSEMFLAKTDLFKGESNPSEVLDAVRQATPESRRAFEAEYGTITPEVQIVAGSYQGGWVEVYKLEEDGTVTTAPKPHRSLIDTLPA